MLVLLAFLNALTTGIQSLPAVSPPIANFCVVTQHSRWGPEMEGLEEKRGGPGSPSPQTISQEQIPALGISTVAHCESTRIRRMESGDGHDPELQPRNPLSPPPSLAQ